MVLRKGCHDPRLLGIAAYLLRGPNLTLWPVEAKEADAGSFGDGDEDLVRGWAPDKSIGTGTIDGAVKTLFIAAPGAPSLPCRSALFGTVLGEV